MNRLLELCVCAAAVELLALEPLSAQISPGELSAAHASLEGLSSCTSCHELGEAVTNVKCLTCHTEIRSRMAAGSGLHGPLAGRRCTECHKEHNGRTFTLVRFDRATFDHAAVGFPLRGKHKALVCEQCHRQEFRSAPDVRRNTALFASKTLLGLPRDCSGCHRDVHGGKLSSTCQQCHGFDAWRPAAAFSHDRTRFRLTGRHSAVVCVKCHPAPAGGGPPSFSRSGAPQCSGCHRDPHGGRFQKPCESCHSTKGWSTGTSRGFDHAATRYPLRGAHRTVPCARCHPSGRFTVRNFSRCADCHADVHRGEFVRRQGGGACESCHTENGFVPANFDHSSAAFTLEGKHRGVACERCHPAIAAYRKGKGTLDFRRGKFDRCVECHADAHAGQLAARSDGGECRACHSVEGFLPTTFSSGNHARTRFALTGAHAALPCVACHPAGAIHARSTRRLRWEQTPVCQTCHADVHRGQFANRFHCGDCHSTTSWASVQFTHERTRFPLSGRHAALPCSACHRAKEGGAAVFAGTPIRCIDCHSATTRRIGQ